MMDDNIRSRYVERFEGVLATLEPKLFEYVCDLVQEFPRIVLISVRRKEVASFLEKSQRLDDDGKPKYTNPISQIYDQIAARIVTKFKADVCF